MSEISNSPLAEPIKQILRKKVGRTPTYEQIQAEIKEKFDKKFTIRQLRWYYNRVVIPDKRLATKDLQDAILKKTEDINIVVERIKLFNKQKERTEKLFEMEKETPLPMDGTSREMAFLNHLLEGVKKDYQDLGMMSKAPEVEIVVNELKSVFLLAIRSIKDRDERQRIIQLVKDISQ